MQDGETLSGGTLRGREQVIEKLSYVGSHTCKNALTDYIFIWHARYPEGANKILDAMNQHNINGKKIRLIDAGPIIAGYMGEKTLGLMHYGDFESE